MGKKLKFVIVSPRQKWGGAIVLHCLCKYLVEEDFDAKIFYTNAITPFNGRYGIKSWLKWVVHSAYDILRILIVRFIGEEKASNFIIFSGYTNLPIKGCKRKYLPFVDKNTIVIYPEIIYGNFLRARNVVRWFLYYNCFENDTLAYGKNDLFICYRKIFNDEKLNPTCRTLHIAYYDVNLYKQTNFEQRNGKCYVIRKGKNRDDLPLEFNGIIIDNLSEKEKVKIFNECEYCISYDTQTAYSSIAALCGCISVVIPEPGKNRTDYRTEEDNSLGVAFGFSKEELEYAKETRMFLKEKYLRINREGKEAVRQFAELCIDYFAI